MLGLVGILFDKRDMFMFMDKLFGQMVSNLTRSDYDNVHLKTLFNWRHPVNKKTGFGFMRLIGRHGHIDVHGGFPSDYLNRPFTKYRNP